jgi:hypothetical protein
MTGVSGAVSQVNTGARGAGPRRRWISFFRKNSERLPEAGRKTRLGWLFMVKAKK